MIWERDGGCLSAIPAKRRDGDRKDSKNKNIKKGK